MTTSQLPPERRLPQPGAMIDRVVAGAETPPSRAGAACWSPSPRASASSPWRSRCHRSSAAARSPSPPIRRARRRLP
ncbi:hypothetical protein [Tessaracoccus defluvii]|uniref:Uncharacterized protein n=1 Tax=Tessaracoccus defluvii TaxID=1285901 RepID=A0A7H0H9S0_9ACTN|nr:hypothetical protein [Tessaracoccus defluvii]QNP57286.1 hypothetical protein H9L22_08650 [Tessaracoccus defluvii]